MKRIKVNYFVERERSGDITATSEMGIEITVSDTVFQKIECAKYDPENCKPLHTLTEALQLIARLQGYKFVCLKTIEDVRTYEYD
jgi:hypothetical protein